MHHELKCWPEPFEAVVTGLKTFELRQEGDRRYNTGDVLTLREWNPDIFNEAFDAYTRDLEGSPYESTERWEEAHDLATEEAYTGRAAQRRVTYVLRGPPWLPPGWCAMAVVPAEVEAQLVDAEPAHTNDAEDRYNRGGW